MDHVKNISPMRVAIIDDEPIACREIKKGLARRTDFDIETFWDGESALKRMETVSFDLVLCDLRLPGMDGINVLKTIKKRFPQTQLIIITAYGSVDVAIRAIQAGAFHFVVKPVKIEELPGINVRLSMDPVTGDLIVTHPPGSVGRSSGISQIKVVENLPTYLDQLTNIR